MSQRIQLPPRIGGQEETLTLPEARQITIVGANGAGKTRFMRSLMDEIGPERSFELSALRAIIPSSGEPSAIDRLYAGKIPLPRQEVELTELDKLIRLLLGDEFRYLLSLKAERLFSDSEAEMMPTKLDRLIELWQQVFPGNQVISESGRLLFSTQAGTNLISTSRLSSGEKTVLYYVAATLYAPQQGVIFIDSPSMFLHPAIQNTLWNAIEGMRPDCTFVYSTNDVEFVNSRTENVCIWVKRHNIQAQAWDYQIFSGTDVPDDLFIDIIGTRKPVLFIEGDAQHSIDSKLYTLVFRNFTVRPLGSCNKVIESTRSFNDLRSIHQLDSIGVVDRDRRNDQEVEYLRSKNILVPDVAEIENMFLLETTVRTMAQVRGKDPDMVFSRVKRALIQLFDSHAEEQTMMHIRHRMKRIMECRADARVQNIGQLEDHLRDIIAQMELPKAYKNLLAEFEGYVRSGDYGSILRVFNYKPMLSETGLVQLLGFDNRDSFITGVLNVLKSGGPGARSIRDGILATLRIDLSRYAAAKPAPRALKNTDAHSHSVQKTPAFSAQPQHVEQKRRAAEYSREEPSGEYRKRRKRRRR